MKKLLKLMKDSGYNRLKLSGYFGVSPDWGIKNTKKGDNIRWGDRREGVIKQYAK